MKTIPVAAIPIIQAQNLGEECYSFSKRIPGIVEGLSVLYREAKLEGLLEIEIEDETALSITRKLIHKGLPVGPSSGLNYAASLIIAKKLGQHKKVVTVFPDRMERYFSTELFNDWRADSNC